MHKGIGKTTKDLWIYKNVHYAHSSGAFLGAVSLLNGNERWYCYSINKKPDR